MSKMGSNRGGFTLIEAVVAVMVMSIAITAAVQLSVANIRAGRLAQERRAALMAASAKVDQLRVVVSNGVSLEGLFQLYGPLDYTDTGITLPSVDPVTGDITGAGGVSGTGIGLPSATGAPLATFAVGEDANGDGILDAGEDLNGNGVLDYYLPFLGQRPMGTVTFITSETPNEADFGNLYNQPAQASALPWHERNPFGVDINGNGLYDDQTPAPFPLDLNGDDDTNDAMIVDGFVQLPVVVTVQWQGPYGPERVDLFAIIAEDRH